MSGLLGTREELDAATGVVWRTHNEMFESSLAAFSIDRQYRFALRRRFGDGPTLNFLMLNPSTADELTNDATVERCQRRAESGGFGELAVTNLFAYRSTDPWGLRDLTTSGVDPIHPLNDTYIDAAAQRADVVVCAWGSHAFIRKLLADRVTAVVSRLRAAGVKLHALKLNEDGMPAHPLYLSYELKPFLWEPTR
jgi:hypothetical protein